MVRDRVTALLVQAASRGLINLDTADPNDCRWWRKISYLLDDVEIHNWIKVNELAHSRLISLLAKPDLSKESLDLTYEKAAKIQNKIQLALLPWLETTLEKDSQTAIKELERRWIETWGDPNDPEVKAEIDRVAKWLKDNDAARK